MEDHEDPVFELPHDALAEASQAPHGSAFDGEQRWVERTDEERAGDAGALEPLTDDAWLEALDVDRDVRELGH